jgi:hypothetical protein
MENMKALLKSVHESDAYRVALGQGHFQHGERPLFSSSGGGTIHSVSIDCNHCAAQLRLSRLQIGLKAVWKSSEISQEALTESCEARHQASEDRFWQQIRELDERIAKGF